MSQLQAVVEIIKNLEPKPGRKYSNERTIYVEPDVAVRKIGDEYVIQLNEDGLPKLRISAAYRRMLRGGNGAIGDEAATYLKDKMRSAVWLIKSLDQRQRTIYKVADSIVRHQRAFLDNGIEHLRPLVLRDVANDIGMHESTVSRVVSNKYIHTPRGLFPMKYFFHSGIDSSTGDDVSSLSIKNKISRIIADEDPRRPHSDARIMQRAARRGDPDRPPHRRQVPRGAAHPVFVAAETELLRRRRGTMTVECTGPQRPGDELRAASSPRSARRRLERHLGGPAQVRVVLSQEKHRFGAEVIATHRRRRWKAQEETARSAGRGGRWPSRKSTRRRSGTPRSVATANTARRPRSGGWTSSRSALPRGIGSGAEARRTGSFARTGFPSSR